MTAAIWITWNSFISGDLDPKSTHFWLLAASICSEFAVAVGILLETHWPRSFKDWFAAISVVGGVSIGALATIFLFQFDEAISGKQQSTIEQQQNKIISLETESNKLLYQIGWRRFSPEEESSFINNLKGHSFKLTVLTVKANNDPEAFYFCKYILQLILKTSIVANDNITQCFSLWDGYYGMSITHPENENSVLLGNAFKAAGVPLSIYSQVSGSPDLVKSPEITLTIGSKTPPDTEASPKQAKPKK